MYEIIKYSKDNLNIDVRFDKEKNTIWLTQNEIAVIFCVNRQAIAKHINSFNKTYIASTCSSEELVQTEGNRQVKRIILLYNFDMIKEISKRSKSISGNDFVEWANGLINNNQHNALPEISLNEDVKSKNYYIRGERVMLDFELAELYGYDTKSFNRQVKNNVEKFPIRYRFQLSENEVEFILRCKNYTSSWGGKRYLPYAFTEQGIYMLMTDL